MGQPSKKSSSSTSSEKKDEEEEPTRIRTASGSVIEEEIKFGEQLQDDLINSFCDKLQAACPRKLEALLAIQFLMISGPEELKKHVSGKREAVQVIYDNARSHYVLVHYNPQNHRVSLYDTLQPYTEDGAPKMIQAIGEQISRLFGHLYDQNIPVYVDREYQAQEDSFSCGYRVIGALVSLALNENPAEYRYGRQAILNFLREVLREPKVTWQMFQNAKISKKRKDYAGNKIVRFWLRNATWIGTSRSRSQSSTTVSSVPSSRTCSSTSINGSQRPFAGSSPSLIEIHEPPPTPVSTPDAPPVSATEPAPFTDWMGQLMTRSFSFFKTMGRRKGDSLVED